MVRRTVAALFVILLLSMAVVSLGPVVGAQQDYNYAIETELTPGDFRYRLYTMVLEEGAELTVLITAVGGVVDIYLLDAPGTSSFLAAMTGASPSGTWAFDSSFSQTSASYFSDSVSIVAPGTYSVAVLNNQTTAVAISGTITGESPREQDAFDWTLFSIILGLGAVAVLLIVVLVLIPRTYRLQSEMDSISRPTIGDEMGLQGARSGFGGKCPYCGYKNRQDSMFCAACGERIT